MAPPDVLFFFGHAAWHARPRIKAVPPALETKSFNHCTTRKVLPPDILYVIFKYCVLCTEFLWASVGYSAILIMLGLVSFVARVVGQIGMESPWGFTGWT